MPARLPLSAQHLLVVTGKGGVGKTTVAAALARAAVGAGRRVLAVEIGRGALGPLLGAGRLELEPVRIDAHLAAATIEPEAALGDFIHGVLRFGVLARRLLESTSFQVLAAAAPGLPELLVLHRLQGWVEARRLGRSVYDLVVVDAPASGHSLPLLAAPRTLGALARLGPIADLLGRIDRLLADPLQTLVCPVTTPEELAVRETIELCREIGTQLRLPLAPPIVNAVPPQRFRKEDRATLDHLEAAAGDHPHLLAARFHLERRRQAEIQIATLKRSLGVAPVQLPYLFAAPEEPEGAARLVAHLASAAGLVA